MRKYKRWAAFMAVLVIGTPVLAACNGSSKPQPPSPQAQGQQITDDYQAAATNSVKYPLDKMKAGGWLERRLLQENLLRQNDPNRIAYVTELLPNGIVWAKYTIQGMVFDLNSQMTPTDEVTCHASGCTAPVVTASPGDNGTWGPEPNMLAFFDTNGVEHKWNGLLSEADSPENTTTKPLVIYNVSATPSVTEGGVKAKSGG